MTWFTDRSRYEEGFKCPTSRYFKYHHAGTGIVKKGNYLPLITGIAIHAALADILQNHSTNKLLSADNPTINKAILQAKEAYAGSIRDGGYLDNAIDRADASRILQEQCDLVEGLVWGWSLTMLPEVLRRFEILAVEQEELYPFVASNGMRINQMSRPDFVARDRETGRIGIHDFKSTTAIDDAFIAQFYNSVQMAVGTLGVEERLGEKVDHYYVHALVKGSRSKAYDTTSSSYSGPRVQNSLFCYAYRRVGQPPFDESDWQPQWKWTDSNGRARTLGRGYEKTPTHEFPGGVGAWTKALPRHLLHDQFAIIGPYDRQEYLIKDYLSGLGTVESGYKESMDTIRRASTNEAGTEVEYPHGEVSRLFPRSYACFDRSGNRCQYYDICFRADGWQEPLGSGKYVRREPHHTTEEI